MIASCSGGGLETGNSEEEDDAPAVISDFIYQGASLHNQTDRTGETALHLAARYSRSDAAKRLLEASADANIQDNMGRTPLHAAVSADAQGVFQVISAWAAGFGVLGFLGLMVVLREEFCPARLGKVRVVRSEAAVVFGLWRDEPWGRALQVLRACCALLSAPPNICVPSALTQILIRNRATDLDARMHDGTTPLILAARLAVEGMLDDLINCHADVNAVDDLGTEAAKTPVHGIKRLLLSISALPNLCCILWFFSPGKSALHWAAAVNNVEAAMVLLKNGANKDMQNNKVESPRLIYAREEPFGESVKE